MSHAALCACGVEERVARDRLLRREREQLGPRAPPRAERRVRGERGRAARVRLRRGVPVQPHVRAALRPAALVAREHAAQRALPAVLELAPLLLRHVGREHDGLRDPVAAARVGRAALAARAPAPRSRRACAPGRALGAALGAAQPRGPAPPPSGPAAAPGGPGAVALPRTRRARRPIAPRTSPSRAPRSRSRAATGRAARTGRPARP